MVDPFSSQFPHCRSQLRALPLDRSNPRPVTLATMLVLPRGSLLPVW